VSPSRTIEEEEANSMYVQLLTDALDEWVLASDRHDVVAHAVECRTHMLLATPRKGEPAFRALAAQVSYDRSLIKLCEVFDIATSPDRFSDALSERRRLENELTHAGLDLNKMSRAKL
jgi:hypothetical protein